MGTDRRGTRTVFQGVLVPDPRITEDTLWASESSYTEAGARADVPAPAQVTAMALGASGDRTTSDVLGVRTSRAGHARSGAEYLWRYTELASPQDDYRGWDAPLTVSAWEVIAYDPASDGLRHPQAVTLSDDRVVICYSQYLGGTMYVRTRTRSTAGTWASAVMPYSETQASAVYLTPCLVVVPRDGGDRLLLLHWSTDRGMHLTVRYSDDAGATWAVASSQCLTYTGTATLRRLRCAYRAGQLVLMMWTTATSGADRETVYQYASTNLGGSWDLVATLATTAAAALPEVVATPRGFVLTYVKADSTGIGAGVSTLLSSAYDRATDTYTRGVILTTFADYNPVTDTIDDGDLALAYDAATDTVWAYGRYSEGSGIDQTVVRYSTDGGATWVAPVDQGASVEGAIKLEDNCGPVNYSATWQRDRVLLVGNKIGLGNTANNSLHCLYLGGYTTRAMPTDDNAGRGRTQFTRTFLPWYLTATSTYWTQTLFGTGAEALTATGYQTSGIASDVLINSATCAGDIAAGQVMMFEVVSMVVGTLRAYLRNDDGAAGYEIRIDVASTGSIGVYDEVATTIIGSALTGQTFPCQILAAIRGSSVNVWTRAKTTSEDRAWTIVATSTGLTDDAGSVGTDRIRWGVTLAAGDGVWGAVQWTGCRTVAGAGAGRNELATSGYTSTTYACGRQYGHGTCLGDGVRVYARGGPTVQGDVWTVGVDHTYPVRAILSGSPRIPWRSTSTAAQAIAWDLHGLSADAAMGSEVLGVAVFGTDSPRVLVEGYVQGSGWTTLGTLDLATRSNGLRYTREGDTVYPDTGAASTTSPVLLLGEFVGGSFAYDDTTSRRVRWNNGSKWTDGTNVRAEIMLSGVDAGDPASGTGGDLWGRSGVLLVHVARATYRGIRVTFHAPSAGTVPPLVDGYHTAGRVVIGPVIVHGDAPDWTETIALESGITRTESRDRQAWRRRSGPDRRRASYAWRPVDETTITDGDPDYVTLRSGGAPVSLHGVAHREAQGLARILGASPCVYLADIRYLPSGTTQILTRQDTHILAALDGDVTITQELGEPHSGGVYTASIALVEEV